MPGTVRHRKSSGVASDGDASHVQGGADWDDSHVLSGALADRQAVLARSASADHWDWDWIAHSDVFAILQNAAGVTLTQGDVLSVSTGTAAADDTLGSLNAFAVCAESSLASTLFGRFWRGGLIPAVKTDGAVSAGHYVVKSPTSRAIRDSGTVAGAAGVPPTGALGIAAATVASAGFVAVLWFSAAPVAPGTTAPPVTAGYLKGTGAGYATQPVPIPLSDLDPLVAAGLSGQGLNDPESIQQLFWEDFVRVGDATGAASATWAYAWLLSTGTVADVATSEGVITLAAAGTGPAGVPHLSRVSPVLNSKNPTLFVRWAQATPTSGIRRIGLGATVPGNATFSLATEPPDGIYFRHTAGGEILGVARASGVETLVHTGVTAADGAYHTGRLVITGTASAGVYLDGALKGTLTTNLPSVPLLLGAGGNGEAVGVGLLIDYLVMRGSR